MLSSNRSRVALVAVVVGGTLGGFAISAQTSRGTVAQNSHLTSAEIAALSQVSASVHRAKFSRAAAHEIAAFRKQGFSQFAELGRRGQNMFYRLTRTDGTLAWAVGSANDAASPIGIYRSTIDPPAFPNPAMPIMDLSVVGAAHPGDPLVFITIEGVAADGVKAIRGLNAAGDVVVTVPVTDNLYSADAATATAPVASIQAVDAAGRVLASMP